MFYTFKEKFYANRTKFDLGVSFGIWLIACEKKYYKTPNEYVQDDSQRWFSYEGEELLQ